MVGQANTVVGQADAGMDQADTVMGQPDAGMGIILCA